MFAEVSSSEFDMYSLNRELDRTKSSILRGTNAAFLGSIMCSLTFKWTQGIQTAATNGKELLLNPTWFLDLGPKTRESVLIHELWHVARLHMIRCGTRDPRIWNIACDIRINNDLERDGYTFEGAHPHIRHDLDSNGLMPEEDIYDELIKDTPSNQNKGGWASDEFDVILVDSKDKQQVINNVVQAVQSSKLMNQAGGSTGSIEDIIKRFLDPIIPWEQMLMQFFTDMLDEDFSWKRPNRRYPEIYMPSRFTDDGRLEVLNYYLDVSGSISEQQIVRFNSELKYIQTILNPEQLNVIQFDTDITDIKEFRCDEPFDEIKVVGRGGTCLIPVRDHIQKTQPTAAIIFSDLYVEPMEPLDYDIPVLWVCYANPGAIVPFGRLIHISS